MGPTRLLQVARAARAADDGVQQTLHGHRVQRGLPGELRHGRDDRRKRLRRRGGDVGGREQPRRGRRGLLGALLLDLQGAGAGGDVAIGVGPAGERPEGGLHEAWAREVLVGARRQRRNLHCRHEITHRDRHRPRLRYTWTLAEVQRIRV